MNFVKPLDISGVPSDRGTCEWAARPPVSNIIGDRLQISDRNWSVYTWNGLEWANPTVHSNADPVTGGGTYYVGGVVSGFVKYAFVPPSGDTTGATDYAAVAPLLLAGRHLKLLPGQYYFSQKLVRGFQRNQSGPLVLLPNNDAQVGNFIGSGKHSTVLNFLDAASAGIEFWTRPEMAYRSAAEWKNPVSGSGALPLDRATSWGGGVTGDFTLKGALPDTAGNLPTGSAAGWVDASPNHIGVLVWGACGDHVFLPMRISNFSVGRVEHDTTGFRWEDTEITNCSVAEAKAIQWDANVYVMNKIDKCRVGTSLTWRGIYETGAYTQFGRESSGTYIPTPAATQGQTNEYRVCRWYHCSQTALAGADDPADKSADGVMWSNIFNGGYFESNALTLIAPQNNAGGAFVFNGVFFEHFNTAEAETLRTSAWFRDRLGISQTSLNSKFCPFTHWFGGGSSDDSLIRFSNCNIGISDYGHVIADAWHVELDRCKFPNGIGNTSSTVVTALGAARGFARTAAGVWWSPRQPITASQGNDTWKLWAGFVSRNGGPYMSTSDGQATPTAAALWRGTLLGITGASGAADLMYACQKSAADTYSWKLLSTG